MQIKPKATNKTKTSKYQTTKATIFLTRKLLKQGKLFILHFFYLKSLLKKNLNSPDNLIYSTTIMLTQGAA